MIVSDANILAIRPYQRASQSLQNPKQMATFVKELVIKFHAHDGRHRVSLIVLVMAVCGGRDSPTTAFCLKSWRLSCLNRPSL
jgi:hypothetical protein